MGVQFSVMRAVCRRAHTPGQFEGGRTYLFLSAHDPYRCLRSQGFLGLMVPSQHDLLLSDAHKLSPRRTDIQILVHQCVVGSPHLPFPVEVMHASTVLATMSPVVQHISPLLQRAWSALKSSL